MGAFYLISMNVEMGRFPFAIGAGWYPVEYSDELAPGARVPLRYFEADLVLSRDAGGVPAVVSAASDGARAWPIHEGAGLISVWYHPAGGAPEFALPAVPEWGDRDWAASWWKLRWTVRTHPQEMRENAIDWPHFRFVHGGSDGGELRRHGFDGPSMTFAIESPPVFSVHSLTVGLGWSVTRITGSFEAITITALTPIDGETTDVRSAFLVRRAALADPAGARGLRQLVEQHARGIEQDIPIWEHKTYRPAPLLCDGDGPITEFRRWAAQFYRIDGPG
jgi:3-ketosteroid 9alpha-monooxygenase subunit A